jgi:hypothetical protein
MHQSGGSRRRQADPYPDQQQANPYQQNPYPPYPEQQPNPYQQPGGYYGPPAGYAPPLPPRRKRRVFMWFFFAVQALFLIWLIVGLASSGSGTSTTIAQQVASSCDHHAWYPLFKSQADCARSLSRTYNDAHDAGTGFAVALLIGLWIAVDFFLGLGYGIYRLATRSR